MRTPGTPRDKGPVGLTQGVGWEVGVSRTFDCSRDHAWNVITSDAGLAAWLGEVDGLRPDKGSPYETADGTTGEIRSYRPGDRVRLTWRPTDWDHDSTVQVALSRSGAKTIVRFHQEHLASSGEREQQRRHWRSALDALAPLLEGAPTGEPVARAARSESARAGNAQRRPRTT